MANIARIFGTIGLVALAATSLSACGNRQQPAASTTSYGGNDASAQQAAQAAQQAAQAAQQAQQAAQQAQQAAQEAQAAAERSNRAFDSSVRK